MREKVRRCFFTVFISLSAIIFSGCTDKNDRNDAKGSGFDVSKPKEVVSAGVEELTAGDVPGVCIDYAINSYDAVNDFAYGFFAQNIADENPVLSPVSAYLALSMAGIGADGDTRKEFEKVLGNDMLTFSDDMMNNFPISSKERQITLANSAWVDNCFTVDQEWLGMIASLMDAEAYQAELSSTEVMESMNRWIEKNTNGLIDQMVEKPLPDDTCLVLFNTLYFKADWADEFEAHMTGTESFTLADGSSVNTEMMRKYGFHADYIGNEFMEGLIFPYLTPEASESHFAFVAVRPKEETTQIRDIYGRINSETVEELLANRQNRYVSTKLPRMEMTFDKTLNESLQNMGIQTAFDADMADFTPMGRTESGENLYISLVRQKAKIIVDESGTEAAAATEVEMEAGCALEVEEPLMVAFDRPFLYMIMDMEREIPLFIGILDHPAVNSETTAESEASAENSANVGWKQEGQKSGREADSGHAEDAASSTAMSRESEEKYMAMADSATDCYEEEYYRAPGTEEYHPADETGFTATALNPLSTFSADVDTASYSNLRRMIEDGYTKEEIPDGAVRIEELLNYFHYDYTSPKRGEPFGVTTQIADCPWSDTSKIAMIGLKTRDIDFSEAPASNLVFLLDVSGSMYSDDKLPLLQKSFSMLTENLSAKDTVSIVVYAGEDRVVLEGVKGSEHREIVNAVNALEAAGSTAGSDGIRTAYRIAEKYFIEGGNNRVILATDGDLNVGLTTEEELEALITKEKESGVYLSVLGFGTGNIKDNKMEILADKGNGNYAYIDSAAEARKVLVEEMGATLVTVAEDVKFQVEFNPNVVSGYRLIGYENRRLAEQDFTDDTKDAGEIGAGHTVTVLYEIVTADQAATYSGTALKYGETKKIPDEEWFTVGIRYKKPGTTKSLLSSYPVDRKQYVRNPGEDMRFAMAVAEFGLVINDSDYKGNATMESVLERLEGIDTRSDEYRDEFYYLVRRLDRN